MKQMLTRLRKLEQDSPTGGGGVAIPAGEYRLAEQVQCAWTDRFMAASSANAEMIEEARTRTAKYPPHLRRFEGPPLHAALLTLSLHMQSTLSPNRQVPDWKRARELDGLLTDAFELYQFSTRDFYPLVERDLLSEAMRRLALPPHQRRLVPPSDCRDEFWRLLTEPDYVHPHLREPPEQAPWDSSPSCSIATTSRAGARR